MIGLRLFKHGLLVLLLLAAPATGDEGFWLFSNPPKQLLKEKYDFDLTPSLLERLQKATVRVGDNGSGCFVSPEGLVVTNWHVVIELLERISAPRGDLLKDGWLAGARTEELRLPGLQLSVTWSAADVTGRVQSALQPDMTLGQAFQARRTAERALVEESLRTTGLESKVVGLFQGGQYELYRSRTYSDVRLVFVPPQQIGGFFDVAFLRAYQDGKPAQVEHFMPWGSARPRGGELTLAAGFPRGTYRFLTSGNLEWYFGKAGFLALKALSRSQVVLNSYAEKNAFRALEAKTELILTTHEVSRQLGRLSYLERALAGIRAREAARQARFLAVADRENREYARKAEALMQRADRSADRLWPSYFFLEYGPAAFNSKLFALARNLVRVDDEDANPKLRQRLLVPVRISRELEIAKLADSLELFATYAADDAELASRLLAGKTPWERARELVEGTRLDDVEVRKVLLEGGAPAVAKSRDAMLVLARLVEPRARTLRRQFDEVVIEPSTQAYALLKAAGDRTGTGVPYPDTTDSLRLTFGKIQVYPGEGSEPPKSIVTLGEVLQGIRLSGQEEQLPAAWKKAARLLAPATPLVFTCSADVAEGLSGGPFVDRRGTFMGVLTLGLGQSADLEYVNGITGSGGLLTPGLAEVLDKVYQAKALLKELGVQPLVGTTSPGKGAEVLPGRSP